jgi:pilus assembly protein CpaB
MRMKSLILIVIALGCGLVASIGISQVMDRGGGAGSVETEKILVALTDIDIGSKLEAQNVKLEDWPKAKVPEGAVRRLEDVKDKFANARFYKGEPLHVSKITDNSKSVADGVPDGYRAMPVKVDEDTVMKAISPGDKVDVMVFLRKNDDIPETGVFTILKNVRVFAINTNTERSGSEPSGKGETSNFRTISLLVKNDQSRDLALAAQMGKILLTLRRPDQKDDELGEDVTPISDLVSGKAKLASEPAAQPRPSQIVQSIQNAVGTSLPSGPTVEVTMEIRSPNGVEKYDWFDRNQSPVKSSLIENPPARPAEQPTPANPPTAEPAAEDEPITTPSDGTPSERSAPGRVRYQESNN